MPVFQVNCQADFDPEAAGRSLTTSVITRDEMFTPILEVCPSFRATWDEFVGEWKDDPDGLPQYLALSDLAQHVIGMLERNEIDGVKAIFGVVETWHLDGDSYVKEAAMVGFLEDLQNTPAFTREAQRRTTFWSSCYRKQSIGGPKSKTFGSKES